MTRRTPTQEHKLIQLAETESQRACTFCRRLELTDEQRQAEPYPEVVEMCELHQRVFDEINEAREMEVR